MPLTVRSLDFANSHYYYWKSHNRILCEFTKLRAFLVKRKKKGPMPLVGFSIFKFTRGVSGFFKFAREKNPFNILGQFSFM